jgi:ketosteroid isomerase-like protein
MAHPNLELVRSIYAGWEKGDFSSIEWAHPQIEFQFVDGPQPGSWTGIAAMSTAYGDWLRGFKDFRAEPERYLVVDDQRIVVFVRNRARGHDSGIELDQRSVANYFEIHGGMVTRLVLYWDRERVLAELGLEP